MGLIELRKFIREKTWKIQLVTGIALIVGIFMPFSLIVTSTILEFMWTFSIIFTDTTGFKSMMNSDLLANAPYQLILPIAGIVYVIIIFLIASLYIIYGIRKKELVNKKGRLFKVPMWRMGLIILVLTVGLLVAQGFFYYQSILYVGSFTFEFFNLHLGSYINIIISLLLIFAGGIGYGLKEPKGQNSSQSEQITTYTEQSTSIPISPTPVTLVEKEEKKKQTTSSKIIIFISLSCLIIASGIGLVFWGIFIWETWIPADSVLLLIFWWALVLPILSIILIGVGVILPIIGITIMIIRMFIKKL